MKGKHRGDGGREREIGRGRVRERPTLVGVCSLVYPHGYTGTGTFPVSTESSVQVGEEQDGW